MVNKKRLRLLVLIIVLMTTVLTLCAGVQAAGQLVVDQAGIFTAEQVSQLEKAAAELGAQYKMDIVIVTTNDAEGKTAMAYADDFFDYNGYGVGANHDGILMLMDFDNRDVWISTTGSGITYLTDAKIESILDDVFANGMESGDYYGAASAFVDSAARAMAPNSVSTVDGIISLLSSGGLGAGIFGGVRRSYKGKAARPVFEYQKNSLVSLGLTADNLFNTYTTSRIIPRPSSSSGGGGSSTHTSSSGGTHGGGGRGF